jgi:signal transduction histidine kinase
MEKRANKEVLVFIPTPNAFCRIINRGTLDLYKQLSKQGVLIRLLIAISSDKDCDCNKIISELKGINQNNNNLARRPSPTSSSSSYPNLQVRTLEESIHSRLRITLVDNREVMMWEIKNDEETIDLHNAIGLGTYSNSNTLVTSYLHIFESLWHQSEIYERLKLNDRLQREFINTAAHELRTPIQPILGMAQVIESKLTNGKDKAEVDKDKIGIIIRNARRLERLSSEILEIAKIESGPILLKKERVNLNELIFGVIRDVSNQTYTIRNTASNNKVKIEYNDTSNVVTVTADRVKLTEVIYNLISNAIKFTNEGTISIESHIQNNEENSNNNGQVIVTVTDTGSGITTDIFPRLFTKFATNSFNGVGLGLYLCKKIIEAHGGKIWAENNKHTKGARFSFTLPLTGGILLS